MVCSVLVSGQGAGHFLFQMVNTTHTYKPNRRPVSFSFHQVGQERRRGGGARPRAVQAGSWGDAAAGGGALLPIFAGGDSQPGWFFCNCRRLRARGSALPPFSQSFCTPQTPPPDVLQPTEHPYCRVRQSPQPPDPGRRGLLFGARARRGGRSHGPAAAGGGGGSSRSTAAAVTAKRAGTVVAATGC